MSRFLLPVSWLGFALLLGCGETESSGRGGSASVNGVTDTEIVIGAHTDLTGPIAIWGTGIAKGARMRFGEANDAGGVHGRQIRYILEDAQYQVPRAVSAANKLINKDKRIKKSYFCKF